MSDYLRETFNQLYQFFVGTIERWNQWILHLEQEADAKEKQLVYTSPNGKNIFSSTVPHAPIKTYDELTFPYNLSSSQIPHFTGHQQVDHYIQSFAHLEIDIFTMIQETQTLPDQTFIQKRFRNIQRESHPDRKGGSTGRATDVNVAKDEIDHLYNTISEQVALFQGVMNDVIDDLKHDSFSGQNTKQTVLTTNKGSITSNNNNGPYVILFCVGAFIGTIVVLKQSKKKS